MRSGAREADVSGCFARSGHAQCIVSVDWRMSTTAMASDYVLPAAHHFGRSRSSSPTLDDEPHDGRRIVEPAGDTRSEVDRALLAQKVQERARARETFTSRDAAGTERRLDDFADQYTGGGSCGSTKSGSRRSGCRTAPTPGPPPGTPGHAPSAGTFASQAGATARARTARPRTSSRMKRTTRSDGIRKTRSVSDAHTSRPVLHRPSVVHRGRRGTAAPQENLPRAATTPLCSRAGTAAGRPLHEHHGPAAPATHRGLRMS